MKKGMTGVLLGIAVVALAGCGKSQADGTWVYYETDKEYEILKVNQDKDTLVKMNYEDGKKDTATEYKINIEKNVIVDEENKESHPYSVKENTMYFDDVGYFKKGSKVEKKAKTTGKAQRIKAEQQQKAIDERVAKSIADVKEKRAQEKAVEEAATKARAEAEEAASVKAKAEQEAAAKAKADADEKAELASKDSTTTENANVGSDTMVSSEGSNLAGEWVWVDSSDATHKRTLTFNSDITMLTFVDEFDGKETVVKKRGQLNSDKTLFINADLEMDQMPVQLDQGQLCVDGQYFSKSN